MMSWWLDQPRIKAIAKNQVFGQSGGQMVTVGALPSTIWLPWLVDVYIMLYIIWFIILIGDCHHPRTGNPVPHRLKGFTMSPGTPLLVQQLLHDGLKPIQLQISSLYMRIYIYIHILHCMVCYDLYFIHCILYTHICIIYIYNYMYIYIHTYMYIIHIYIHTYVYILSILYIYCRISHKKNSSPFVRRAPNEASQTPARGWSPEDPQQNPPKHGEILGKTM